MPEQQDELTKQFTADSGTTHTLRVINEKTGEVELECTNLDGGIFIVHKHKDLNDKDVVETIMATDQAVFGVAPIIAMCAIKMPGVIKNAIARDENVQSSYNTLQAMIKS